MKSENIETNTTKGQINSANELISENFEHEALTANTKYCTINSTDIENGSAELVLISPLEGDDSGISVACVEDEECCDPSLSENEEDIVVGVIQALFWHSEQSPYTEVVVRKDLLLTA